MIVVVDVANVLGSRPDGWWRDRAAAAGRLLDRMAGLPGSVVVAPDGGTARIDRVVAVLEGAARSVPAGAAAGIEVVRAERDGDTTVVAQVDASLAERDGADPADVLVVTADRGLRQRLSPAVRTAGPGWFNGLIGR